MTIKFFTELLVFLSAVVALYKTAIYSKEKREENNGKFNSNYGFSTFLEILEYLCTILLFPLMVLVFNWIFNLIITTGYLSSTTNKKVTYAISYEISEDPSKSELMFIAANQITYSTAKNDALKKVVKYSLENQEEKIAILAATSISYNTDKEEQLELIVTYIQNSNE